MTYLPTRKRFISPLAALLCLGGAALLSCAKPMQVEEPDEAPSGDGPLVTVLFSPSDERDTKVTGAGDESECAIGRWALFVFDDQTGWLRWESASGGTPLPMKLRAGRDYVCYAVANYSTTGTGAFIPSSVRTPADIVWKVAYLGDNRVGSLLMYGSAPVTPDPVAYDPDTGEEMAQSMTVSVRRLVSRIDLRGLRVDFSASPHLAAKTFTLRSVYVTNVYRTTRYGNPYAVADLSTTRSAWYNTGGWHRGEAGVSEMDALLGDIGINRVVSPSSPYTVTHSFYAFPNPTPRSQDVQTMGAWTRRCTRLVIEASIDDDVVYYAIAVPSMVRNRIYAASNVVIHGRGSNDPEVIDIDPDIIEATIAPIIDDDWDGAGSVTLD